MTTLPSNFPIDEKIISAIDLDRVQWFYRRYVEDYHDEYLFGHFLMAAYCAVPAILTPDLMYQIWQNFNGYKWLGKPVTIHRIAVADILLSPFCHEVGLDLFEMNLEIRLGFLKWLEVSVALPLWQKREIFRMQDIALFVTHYHQIPNTDTIRWGTSYVELQKGEAESYVNPGRRIEQLMQNLRAASAADDQSEILRNIDNITKTRKRLETIGIADLSDLQQDLDHFEIWKALIQWDADKLKDLPNLQDLFTADRRNGMEVKSKNPVLKSLKAPEQKLRVFVLGAGNQKSAENSARLFAGTLADLVKADKLHIELLTGPDVTKSEVISALEGLLATVNERDDLVLYIAADTRERGQHCAMIFPEVSGLNSNESRAVILDEEIGALLAQVRCSSITLIIQVDNALTPFWLDTTHSGHVIMASARFENQAEYFAIEEGHQVYYLFTYFLVKAMRESRMQITNRQLFAETLCLTDKQGARIGKMKQKLWDIKATQMLGDQNSYNQFFLQGHNSRVQLQNLLRQTRFLDERPSGNWDENTVKAFSTYCLDAQMQTNAPIQTFIQDLQRKCDTIKSEQPLYLLIFSDPHQRLKLLDLEKDAILNLLEPWKEQVLVLENPDKNAISGMLRKTEYRNRIAMVYYSGFDDLGDFELKDGTFTILDFAREIDFQENIQLFVSNTCGSGYFAAYMTQLGIRMAVGADDNIDDSFGQRFGVALFEHILKDGAIEAFIDNFNFKGNGVRQR